MQGSMRETPPGSKKWRLRVFIGTDGQGKKRYKERRFTGGKREAQQALTDLLVTVRGISPDSAGTLTVADYFDRWQQWKWPQLSPSTQLGYDRVIRTSIIPAFGHLPISKLSAMMIDRWTVERCKVVSSTTHLQAWTVLSAALTQATKWDLLEVNPCKRAHRPKPAQHTPTLPTGEQVTALTQLTDLQPWLAVTIALAVGTGARRSQLAALQWGDITGKVITWQRRAVHDANKGVTVLPGTKSKPSYVTPIGDDLVEVLQVWRDLQEQRALDGFGVSLSSSCFVLAPPPGVTPVRPDAITLAWKRHANRHGLTGVRFHDLRHFVGTRLIAAGVDVRTVAELMGHRDATVTLQVYAHTDIDRMRAAMEQAGIK